ncbi:MAG: peptidase E [Actinobacteria bacterium]|nr:peptidase E [Actinomycetota bacterium]
MTAAEPTILATSGGLLPARRTRWEFGPLTDYAVELAGVTGRAPRVCFVATAMGDSSDMIRYFYDAALQRRYAPSHLALFPMPNVADPAELLLEQDLIWVFGGSVAGLLAMWRMHGIDEAMRAAWQAGVVLTGVSAGSICWHIGGTTDSYGPDLRPVTDGLAMVPFSNGVHYDSEPQRRPLFQSLIGDGTLPAGYATDDGTGVLYRGERFVEAVSEKAGKQAYHVCRTADGTVVEEPLETRLLTP